MAKKKLTLLISFICILNLQTGYCDTITMKDKKVLKGVVVEKYADRIILSTIDGEIEVLRSDIKDVIYDAPEQSYYDIGMGFEMKDRLNEANYYYKKALDAKPDFQEAKEAVIRTNIAITKSEEKAMKRALSSEKGSLDAQLEHICGISLKEEGGWIKASIVKIDSYGYESGLRSNDAIVSMWGNPVRGMAANKVKDELVNSTSAEVRVTIERKVLLPRLKTARKSDTLKEWGFSVALPAEGLMVKSVNPQAQDLLAKDDMVIAIEDQPTRYMPLRDFYRIANGAGKKLSITIRRNLFLKRRLI